MNAHISSVQISIHALREEGDLYADAARILQQAISIHALREEGDLFLRAVGPDEIIFLSTPSVRRATRRRLMRCCPLQISIHALREEGDSAVFFLDTHIEISIHALREEGDARHLDKGGHENIISIHALREEGDAG